MNNFFPEKQYKELLEAAERMQSAMIPMINQFKAASKAMEPTRKMLESIRINIEPTLKLIERWQKDFIPIFNKIDFQNLIKQAKKRDTPAFKKFITDWGWLIDKKSVSFGDYCYGIYNKYGDKGFRDKINRWFLTKKHISTVSEKIKLVFLTRYKIINEGLNFHTQKNYPCAITLLLPHAEGILWDIAIKKGFVKKGYNSKKKYIKYKNNPKNINWELQELSKKLFPNDKFHQIIVREIFCEGPRNKILHGRNIYEGKQREISRWKSTLLILTLWRLSDE